MQRHDSIATVQVCRAMECSPSQHFKLPSLAWSGAPLARTTYTGLPKEKPLSRAALTSLAPLAAYSGKTCGIFTAI
jgi:hypothetical protein